MMKKRNSRISIILSSVECSARIFHKEIKLPSTRIKRRNQNNLNSTQL